MAIGRISGSVLKSNLTRNGTDLAIETNLLYLDVTNSRVGIGTSSPATTLDVSGTITATTVTTTNLTIGGATPIIGKKEGTNFNESLLVGHSTTGTLDAAQWNVGVGIEALDAITSGDGNTAIGNRALSAVTSGGYNTCVGIVSGFAITEGDFNTGVGRYSLGNVTTGDDNTAMGNNALYYNQTGSNNTAIGRDALEGTTSASNSNNTAIGYNACAVVTTGDANIALGYQAGNNITTGSGNVVIGNADVSSATGDDQLSISDGEDGSVVWITGDSSGTVTIDGNIQIGDNKITTSTSNSDLELSANGTGTIAISGTGTSALLTLTTDNVSSSASPIIALKRINQNNPADNDNLGQIKFLGEATDSSEVEYGRITTSIFDSAAGSMDGKMQIMLQEGGTLTNAVRFESNTLFLNTGNTITFEGSVADSNETILTVVNPTADRTISLPDATGDLIPGKFAGTDFTRSILLGHNTTGTLDAAINNVGIGFDSLNAITSGDGNAALGYDSLGALTSGGSNTAIGANAGMNITTGHYNLAVGGLALLTATTAGFNTAIGYQSLRTATGHSNTALGRDSGYAVTTGNYNILIGRQGAANITSGDANIIIGNVDADSVTDDHQLKIAGYDGTTTVNWIKGTSTGAITFNGAYTFPTADGTAGTFLKTDGSGALTFAEAGGGGGGNNTAIKQINYYKLTTSSAVIDEFDLEEFRGAVYNIEIDDTDNSFIGHVKVSVVHNGTTPFISVYDLNEDSTRIVDFSAAISGTKVQLSGVTNVSSHTNLRIYRIALGDHHETVSNTNSKIIATSTAITSSATTLDSFTKTDIQGAKYVILIKDSTQTEYQISEISLTHDGTTVYFNDYAKVSTRSDYAVTYSAAISGATLTLSGASTGGITATAILYRQDLGSKTKLGEVDNILYGKLGDVDSTVKSIDEFDVFKYKSARYFINIGHAGDTEYQNSEITLNVNSAGTGATISESVVRTGTTDLATFTADVSSNKARLRMQGTSANNVIYFARLAMEANNIYRANGQSSDDLYITHSNIIGPSTLDSKDIITGKIAGTNFANSLIVGHATTGTLTVSNEQNTAVGVGALSSITGGYFNTVMGYNAGTATLAGGYSVYIGTEAGQRITNALGNTLVGWRAGEDIVSTNGNTLIGKFAGGNVTGTGNIALGEGAGDNITSGSGNIMIGNVDADSATGSHQLKIDGYNGSSHVLWISGDSSGNVTFPAEIDGATLDISGNADIDGTLEADAYTLGGSAFIKLEGTDFTGSLLIGHSTTGTLSTASQNTGVGINAMDAITSADNTTCVGWGAGTAVTSGTENTFIGGYSGYTTSTTSKNTGVGVSALQDNTGSSNTAVGWNSGAQNSSGSYNTSLGDRALSGVDGNAHSFNTALGYKSNELITTGDYNITIGMNSGDNITTGSGNIIIGTVDAGSATGDRQLKIVGYDGTTTTTWVTGDSSGNITLGGNLTVSGSVTSTGTTDSGDTTAGGATSIGTSAKNIDTFTTSTYDSAFYLAVTRDEINEEVATAQISLVHNDTTAFVASAGLIQSGTNTQMDYTADISSGTVRLRGTGTAVVNSIKFFRIGLGDNTSAATTGNVTTIINTDVDSATENLDTWAHASYRGAKYYISANNSGKTELENIECMVVHNGSAAFITSYNDVYTGNNPLLTLTADISGNDVRLRASGNEPNTAVKMYRILLGDAESGATGTNTNVIGATTVSSSATSLDTFSVDSYTGIHYIVVGYNSGESGTPASISEVLAVSDGSGAYVGNSQISTKGTDQLAFTAALSGTTVTLSAASTSGGSTTVNAYRVHMLRTAAGATAADTVLVATTQTISGAKTFSAAPTLAGGTMTGDLNLGDNVDINFGDGNDLKIYHNGSNSFISDQMPGGIYVLTNDFRVRNPANDEDILRAGEGGDVELYYNDALKFTTTGFGVTIGGATAMGVTSDPSTLADHAHIYAKDDSASAEVYVRDEAGNVTKLSPHNEKGEWEYFSRNTKTGKTVRVNMEEMVRDIEKLTGKTYIKNE